MNEPFATLFHGYGEHWLIGKYLKPDGEPAWDQLLEDPLIGNLSSGETTLIHVASLFRPFRECSLYNLDRKHRTRVAMALLDLP